MQSDIFDDNMPLINGPLHGDDPCIVGSDKTVLAAKEGNSVSLCWVAVNVNWKRSLERCYKTVWPSYCSTVSLRDPERSRAFGVQCIWKSTTTTDHMKQRFMLSSFKKTTEMKYFMRNRFGDRPLCIVRFYLRSCTVGWEATYSQRNKFQGQLVIEKYWTLNTEEW